jgi:hypothetical protein
MLIKQSILMPGIFIGIFILYFYEQLDGVFAAATELLTQLVSCVSGLAAPVQYTSDSGAAASLL